MGEPTWWSGAETGVLLGQGLAALEKHRDHAAKDTDDMAVFEQIKMESARRLLIFASTYNSTWVLLVIILFGL